MSRARAVAALAGCVALAAVAPSCGGSEPGATWVIECDAPAIDLRTATWAPSDAVTTARRAGPGRLSLTVRRAFRGALRVDAPGACSVEATFDADGSTKHMAIAPRIAIPAFVADQGFDRDVEVRAVAGCANAPAIAWTAKNGAPLVVKDGGLVARTHTPPLASALGERRAAFPDWGIVPLSPRTQGAIDLEARWDDAGRSFVQRVHVTAAPRATGIPTVPAGGRVMLFGEGWRAQPDAHGKSPTLTQAGGFTELDTRTTGRFVLADASGRRLAVRVGRFDEMPLDCARSDCHADVGKTIQASPMTHIFERGVGGGLGDRYEPACAIACHALGEPGVDDGGFVHLARVLGARLPAAPDAAWFADMPRDLRRTSGVGCLACHGPAAIPEPDARWSVLRASVCATCHDAPPKYAHVEAWSRSRMAIADRAAETRAGECAACHTTAGFLVAIGARKEIVVPAEAGALGVTCAACHSPHARDASASLVRKVALPASFVAADVGSSASGPCAFCHGAREGATPNDLPRASAARLAFAPGPHVTPRGCLACHGGARAPGAEADGAGHAFQVDRATCKPCHSTPPAEKLDARGRTIAERAEQLWRSLVRRGVVIAAAGATPHASARYAIAPGASSKDADAARRVAAVHDDPAAASHNAARARALLDEAEALAP